MDIYQFRTLMNKNKEFPVYVFYGDEGFFIHEAISALEANYFKEGDNVLALFEFNGRVTQSGVIFDELRTLPFFTDRKKLVIVEEADEFVEKNRETIEKYSLSPAKYASLVLLCDKWDKRTKLSSLIDEIGISVECRKLKDHLLQNWVSSRVGYYKKSINANAAQQLIEDVGNNLAILDKHIEKLLVYLGERSEIEEKDIEALVGIDRNRTIFELTEAVAQKDVANALKFLNQMLYHGEDSVKIISLLAWQLKRLWRAKQILRMGGDESKISSELQLVPFFAKRFFEQIKLYTEEDLMRKYALLLETDVKSKTSSLSTQLLLELLAYRLCT